MDDLSAQDGVWPVWDDHADEDNGSVRTESEYGIDSGSDISDSDDADFVPRWTETFSDVVVRPFVEQSGPSHNLPEDANERDFFHLFFPRSLIRKIRIETNRYADQMQRIAGQRDHYWTPTKDEELSSLLGLFLIMGINPVPDYSQYWGNSIYMSNEGITAWDPKRRFEKFLQYLHLNDNETDLPLDHPDRDLLHKVCPVMDVILEKCRTQYKARKNLSIDEGMIAYRGRHEAKQYIPSKPVRWGIKVWMICDSESGFFHKFEFYMGRRGGPEKGLTAGLVDRLTADPHNKSLHVYFDSFFTSVDLVQNLLFKGIYGCGSIRVNRKHIPADLKQQPLLERGQSIARQDGNLVITKWMDKKPVTILPSNADARVIGAVTRRKEMGPLLL